MFVLVVTGKKELADDRAVLLGNAYHGLCLLKLEWLYFTLCKTGGKYSIGFPVINSAIVKILMITNVHK